MLTKKELESVPVILRRIERLRERLDERQPLQAIRYDKEQVQTSIPEESSVESLALWRQQLDHKITQEYARLAAVRCMIMDFMSTIDDEEEREVVELYCFEGLTLEETADRIHSSTTSVWRKYQNATKNL
uniref:ECF-type sigma factor n=1 Tax=Ndongobacter massiliensis TaxID=1871025 RepID=UPI0009300AE5|nr:sigma factor-like helix-turn-helix DNA-binding protein [Ndongobacter massiliensis]